MSDRPITPLSFDEYDEMHSPRFEATDFDRLAKHALTRRNILSGGLAFGTAALVMGTTTLSPRPAVSSGRLGFEPVAANSMDTVTVPKGYRWQIVIKWGDPLWSDAAAFDPETRGTGTSQERAFGDNNDGMAMFVDGDRSVLAVNNEYTNRSIIYGNRDSGLPEGADDEGSAWCEYRRTAGNRR